MKATLTTTALIAAVVAQDYNVTSRPFQLVLHGDVSGTVDACDLGRFGPPNRSLVSFCYYELSGDPSPYTTFNFNTTSSAQAPVNRTDVGIPGLLTWFQPNRDYPPIPAFLGFTNGFEWGGEGDLAPIVQPVVRVPAPIVGRQLVTFNDQDELVVPDSEGTKKWFVCQHKFGGAYTYRMVIWGAGTGGKGDPPCVAADGMKRVFI